LFLLERPRGRIHVRECRGVLDALGAFAPLANDAQPFLLESGMIVEGLGRYSFMGSRPFVTVTSRGHQVEIRWADGRTETRRADPFFVTREMLRRFAAEADCPVPFATGAAGYFGYDLCHHIERLPATAHDDIGLPEMYLAFYDRIAAVDHVGHTCYLIANDLGEGAPSAKDKLDALESTLLNSRPVPLDGSAPAALAGIGCNFTRADYCRAVQRAIDYIAAGDIFQVNLSQRFHTRIESTPLDLYRRLRAINPAPMGGYLQFGDGAVVSASPELFLRVRGRRVETRPIKGTRPRGRNDVEDDRMRRELLASAKDAAELTMIVDLERNDLGRVCEYGSVRVTKARALETHPTVFHLVATVQGVLHERHDLIDLLRASFPGGSITGAPKIRAMQIIDELEPTRRSAYTGSMGWIGFDGNADLNIIIRTFLVRGKDAWFQTGGGIVADSDPDSEYNETLDKARALMRAIGARESDIA
jgi:para-aminobenzoate synthetase component 1